MKYMLLVCTEPGAVYPDTMEADTEGWVAEMDGRGVRLLGEMLGGRTTATTVRVRDEEVLLADGPFAETKEQIAGFDIIDVTDLDEALEVAAKHPMSKVGLIEVRPFVVWDE